MSRCAELTVRAGGCHLTEHVLIDVTHRVAVVHIERVDTVHETLECAGTLDHERRIFHKTGVRIAVRCTDSLDEGEDVIANHAEHVLRTGVLEDRPAHVVIWDVAVVVVVMPSAFGEDGVLETVTPHGCVRLFLTLFIVQHLHEEQIGHLLQDVHGVRHTGCPEHIPNTVNLILNFAGYHIIFDLRFVCFSPDNLWKLQY